MSDYSTRLREIIERIEDARKQFSAHHIVKIVAVSKYTDVESIQGMFDAGQRAFGESRVQDLTTKQDALKELPIEWHFIGRLQTNKINHLIETKPFLVHSLDSLKLAEALDKRLEAKGERMNCLLQVNASDEESKAGVEPEEAVDVYQQIKEQFPGITLKGIMTIGAHVDDEAVIKASFERTQKIYESLQKEGATVCSMGMSGDFELAIACGSNMVRLGSVLFP